MSFIRVERDSILAKIKQEILISTVFKKVYPRYIQRVYPRVLPLVHVSVFANTAKSDCIKDETRERYEA